MIEISPSVQIDEREIEIEFVRASGPGGQNVNKVATAAQLRWDVAVSESLTPEVKARLVRLAGSRMTDEGILIIDARRYRSQEQNRLDAIQRLVSLVRQALERPKMRRPTRPSRAAQRARLDEKRRRAQVKQIRRARPGVED